MGGDHLRYSAALPGSSFFNSTGDFDTCVFNGIKIGQYLTELLGFEDSKMAAAAILNTSGFGFLKYEAALNASVCKI